MFSKRSGSKGKGRHFRRRSTRHQRRTHKRKGGMASLPGRGSAACWVVSDGSGIPPPYAGPDSDWKFLNVYGRYDSSNPRVEMEGREIKFEKKRVNTINELKDIILKKIKITPGYHGYELPINAKIYIRTDRGNGQEVTDATLDGVKTKKVNSIQLVGWA